MCFGRTSKFRGWSDMQSPSMMRPFPSIGRNRMAFPPSCNLVCKNDIVISIGEARLDQDWEIPLFSVRGKSLVKSNTKVAKVFPTELPAGCRMDSEVCSLNVFEKEQLTYIHLQSESSHFRRSGSVLGVVKSVWVLWHLQGGGFPSAFLVLWWFRFNALKFSPEWYVS